MFTKVITKVLSHSDTVVKKGADDVRKGEQTWAGDAFSQRGRDTQQKQREERQREEDRR